MAVWPVSLMQQVLSVGYEETYADNVIRATPVFRRKYRLRDTVVLKLYSVATTMTSDDVDTFLGFWRETLVNGTMPFDWVRFDDGQTAHSYVMRGDPEIVAASSNTWRTAIKLADATPRAITVPRDPAIVTWPSDLPEYPSTDGLKMAFDGFTLRSQYSPGQSARVRARRTEKSVRLSQMMTLSQKRTFEQFYEESTGTGVKPFTHYGFSVDGGEETYSFSSPPIISALGGRLFSIALSLVEEH